MGTRVRITAQLIDSKTEGHLWAERYDRDVKDIFTLQDEVREKIITALAVLMTQDDHSFTRFTSLMPRWMAQTYYKLRTGKNYFMHTHSLSEFCQSLQGRGCHDRFFLTGIFLFVLIYRT